MLRFATVGAQLRRQLHCSGNWDRLMDKVKKTPSDLRFSNQTIHHNGSSDIGEALEGIVDQYRGTGLSYAFGYGSKVFSQGKNVDVANSQIDMVFVAQDTLQWHKQNVKHHRGDYSTVAALGAGTVDAVGKWGAGVYFNPFVDVRTDKLGLELKYGVTSVSTLCKDLLEWNTLYLAGRMQKPVAVVVDDPHVAACQQVNLVNALRLALVMSNLPELSRHQLYMAIAGVSYLGDPRVKMRGEDPHKVRNIVDNQYDKFDALYGELLTEYLEDVVVTQGDALKVDVNALGNVAKLLPGAFRARMETKVGVLSLADRAKLAVSDTVAIPALIQSVKGVVTAGVLRSWKYAAAKRRKYRQGL